MKSPDEIEQMLSRHNQGYMDARPGEFVTQDQLLERLQAAADVSERERLQEEHPYLFRMIAESMDDRAESEGYLDGEEYLLNGMPNSHDTEPSEML